MPERLRRRLPLQSVHIHLQNDASGKSLETANRHASPIARQAMSGAACLASF
jgi:hypothetical protein